MTQYQRIVLASRPQGAPTAENFRLETASLPAPAPGEVLLRTIWMSLDPYMRGRMDAAKSYAAPVEIGDTMEAGGVAEVIASADDALAPGDIVVARTGWASHAIAPAKECRRIDPSTAPISTALGVLGMPGHTAWVGLTDILDGQPNETIVVSAATGAVGSLVCQLAKRRGMHVIGVAGGAEKCAYATTHLGCDICLDHRAPDLADQMRGAAPNGIDCYFENVGGKTLEATLARMNTQGRIAVCGAVSWYSGKGLAEAMPLPKAWRAILTRRLRVQGFIIFDHFHRFGAFVKEVAPLVASGEIHYRETVETGLENAPAAFLRLLQGGNFGKQLVRIGPDP